MFRETRIAGVQPVVTGIELLALSVVDAQVKRVVVGVVFTQQASEFRVSKAQLTSRASCVPSARSAEWKVRTIAGFFKAKGAAPQSEKNLLQLG